jgi:hypothetical protein
LETDHPRFGTGNRQNRVGTVPKPPYSLGLASVVNRAILDNTKCRADLGRSPNFIAEAEPWNSVYRDSVPSVSVDSGMVWLQTDSDLVCVVGGGGGRG